MLKYEAQLSLYISRLQDIELEEVLSCSGYKKLLPWERDRERERERYIYIYIYIYIGIHSDTPVIAQIQLVLQRFDPHCPAVASRGSTSFATCASWKTVATSKKSHGPGMFTTRQAICGYMTHSSLNQCKANILQMRSTCRIKESRELLKLCEGKNCFHAARGMIITTTIAAARIHE